MVREGIDTQTSVGLSNISKPYFYIEFSLTGGAERFDDAGSLLI